MKAVETLNELEASEIVSEYSVNSVSGSVSSNSSIFQVTCRLLSVEELKLVMSVDV